MPGKRASDRQGGTIPISQEWVLAILLAGEILLFGVVSKNFLTAANAFEIIRASVEVGLLAVALTPVIVSGGIDLSVGSLMGLAAVVLGMLWRDAKLPIGLAAGGALVVGGAAGWLNGMLITRLKLPALIVTLATLSLYRGLAEGMTRGVENYTSFPDRFLYLGQGYLFGVVPVQLPVMVIVAAGFWWLLQRTVVGRTLVAIGHSVEGARYAGIPVERRWRQVYLLSGLVASVASIVYVSHLGQAKADAGTGYELLAITAVVLGGASIFGGSGTIPGTLLGLLTIVVLQNGLRLAAMPAELAGILIGLILLVTIAVQRLATHSSVSAVVQTLSIATPQAAHPIKEEIDVKNSQVAVICGVILVAAGILAGTQWQSSRQLAALLQGMAARLPAADGGSAEARRNEGTGAAPRPLAAGPLRPITVAMMPKSKGNAYFIACRKGAEEAARELGVELIWDGPTDTDPARQNEIVDTWITRGVDVIAVAVENRSGIAGVLRKARERGIKVITWDADTDEDARDFLVNQATPEGIGTSLMDHAGRILNGQGEFAIITASLTAANQIEWQKWIEKRRAAKFPNITMAALRACDDRQDRAFDEANTVLNAYPNVKLIMSICTPAVPGAAEAVKQARRNDVKVIGLGLPNDNKPYVKAGITDAVVLWSTADLGYLTIHVAKAVKEGTLRLGDKSFSAGRLQTVEVAGDNVLLGQPLTFTTENIDQFDF